MASINAQQKQQQPSQSIDAPLSSDGSSSLSSLEIASMNIKPISQLPSSSFNNGGAAAALMTTTTTSSSSGSSIDPIAVLKRYTISYFYLIARLKAFHFRLHVDQFYRNIKIFK